MGESPLEGVEHLRALRLLQITVLQEAAGVEVVQRRATRMKMHKEAEVEDTVVGVGVEELGVTQDVEILVEGLEVVQGFQQGVGVVDVVGLDPEELAEMPAAPVVTPWGLVGKLALGLHQEVVAEAQVAVTALEEVEVEEVCMGLQILLHFSWVVALVAEAHMILLGVKGAAMEAQEEE